MLAELGSCLSIFWNNRADNGELVIVLRESTYLYAVDRGFHIGYDDFYVAVTLCRISVLTVPFTRWTYSWRR